MSLPYLTQENRSRRDVVSAAWHDAVRFVRWAVGRGLDWFENLPVVGKAVPALGVVTGFGWLVLILAVVTWSYGRSRNWMELIACSILLGTVWILAVAWTLGKVRYAVELSLASDRVVVGDSAVGSLKVTNTSSRLSPSSVVEIPVGATLAQFAIPMLGSGAMHDEVFTVPTQRRGVITIGPVKSVRGDGLGLLRREALWSDPIELYVYPKMINVQATSIGYIRDIEGATTRELSSNDVAFHALRDYTPGDDRRNVHWRTTARTGRLMVRQFEETRRAHLLILMDNDMNSWYDIDEYELGVSVAASVGSAVLREHRELSVMSQSGRVSTSSPRAFFDGMTLLQSQQNLAGMRDLARVGINHEPNASVVVIVTGRETAIADLHAAHSQIPLSAKTLVLRVDSSQERVTRQLVAGMPVITIPSLDELPLAMRKAVV